jgi:hypothetical protein
VNALGVIQQRLVARDGTRRPSREHAARARVLDAAYERFVRSAPVPPALPTAAWINKPDTKEAAH